MYSNKFTCLPSAAEFAGARARCAFDIHLRSHKYLTFVFKEDQKRFFVLFLFICMISPANVRLFFYYSAIFRAPRNSCRVD